MTKEAALYQFFNSFGIPAYPSSAVPDDAVFPWLTYDAPIGSFDDGEMSITANLWYYGESESKPNEKAREIAERIGYGGIKLRVDGGYIEIKRILSRPLVDENNVNIKRRYLDITVEYLTPI